MNFRLDLSENESHIKLFRNIKTGQRFLAHEEPNGDVIYAELDENDKTVNAGNQYPKEEYNKMLDDFEIVADYNTVNFTFSDGKFVKRERPERV